jgi:hypothetical protein
MHLQVTTCRCAVANWPTCMYIYKVDRRANMKNYTYLLMPYEQIMQMNVQYILAYLEVLIYTCTG